MTGNVRFFLTFSDWNADVKSGSWQPLWIIWQMLQMGRSARQKELEILMIVEP